MKAKTITFILGAIVGGLGVFFAVEVKDPPAEIASAPKSSPPRINPDSDAKKIARLEKKVAELEAAGSIADVEEEGEEVNPSNVVKIFSSEGASGINLAEIREKMEEGEKERAEKLINSRLATLRSKLNLSDEQVEKVRELLEKDVSAQPGGIAMLLESAVAGGLQRDDEPSDDFDFDAELDKLLDDDQRAAYAKHIEAQNQNYVEASANRELAQLQTSIPDLTSEQKDRAFDAFTRLAQDEVATGGVPAAGGMNFDIVRMIKQREAKNESLDNILTPEQAEVYKAGTPNTFTLGGAPGQVITRSIVLDSADITLPTEDDGD